MIKLSKGTEHWPVKSVRKTEKVLQTVHCNSEKRKWIYKTVKYFADFFNNLHISNIQDRKYYVKKRNQII